MVVAPKRVVETVWPAELKKWRPDLTIALALGTPGQRRAAFKQGADIVAINRENVKDIPAGYKTIVIDELSSFKSRQAKRWSALKKHTEKAQYVWGLTGTPSPNGLLDLWPQMYLIDNGERLGKRITHFRNRYFRPGRQLQTGVVIEWVPHPTTQAHVEDKLADIALSMQAEDYLDLPELTVNRIDIPLEPKVKTEYARMRDELIADMTGGGDYAVAANAAVRTGKLSQITAGFLYDDETGEAHQLHDEKTKAAVDLVDEVGSPVLVFYRFKEERRRLLKAIPGARAVEEPGVIDDWNAGRVRALLAHPASAGHGLNLQAGGHTILWTSGTWSLEEYLQGNGRLHRQGQTRPVMVHHLTAPGTVDVAIMGRLQDKRSVQDALLEALGLL